MSRVILQPGQWLRGERGQIAVLEWVGEGSYARVYRGEGPRGPVAIKLAKSEVEGTSQRLRREEELLAQGLHPAIPLLHDTGTLLQPGQSASEPAWIAMSWLRGETLRRRLEAGKGLPLVQAVPMLHRLAEALAALHAAGWVHGDLRPDNVLLEAGSHQAFLLDFGEAQRVEHDRRQPSVISRVRQMAPRAVAPECAHTTAPAPPSTTDADLRQLGELLAWTLTGVDPTRDPDRLSRAAGYHAEMVQLWHDSRRAGLTAATCRDRLHRLARHLGVGAARG